MSLTIGALPIGSSYFYSFLLPSSISIILPTQLLLTCTGKQQLQPAYLLPAHGEVTSCSIPKTTSEYARMSFQYHFPSQCPFDLRRARSPPTHFSPTRDLTLAALIVGADTSRQDQWPSSDKFDVRRP